VKPRKRRRTSFAGSALSHETEASAFCSDRWPGRFYERDGHDEDIHKWEKGSQYHYPESDASIEWEAPYENGNDVEEIVRSEPLDSGASSAIIRSRSQYPDLAMIAPSPVASPLAGILLARFPRIHREREIAELWSIISVMFCHTSLSSKRTQETRSGSWCYRCRMPARQS
jgi:hypothetical protein